MKNNIQTIIDKFHKLLFDNLSGDEIEQFPVLEQFLKDSLTSMLDEIEKSIKVKQLGEDDEYDGYAIDCDSWNACHQEVINIINSHR